MPMPRLNQALIRPIHRGPTLCDILPKPRNSLYMAVIGVSLGYHYLKLDMKSCLTILHVSLACTNILANILLYLVLVFKYYKNIFEIPKDQEQIQQKWRNITVSAKLTCIYVQMVQFKICDHDCYYYLGYYSYYVTSITTPVCSDINIPTYAVKFILYNFPLV